MTTANVEPQLTILVPTRNEAENVEPLLRRLSAVVEPAAVVLFVDDSDDDTPGVIEAAQELGIGSVNTKLLHRSSSQRTGGLGGAVLTGLKITDTPWVCVMDGDFQHPPEVVPRLLCLPRARCVKQSSSNHDWGSSARASCSNAKRSRVPGLNCPSRPRATLARGEVTTYGARGKHAAICA